MSPTDQIRLITVDVSEYPSCPLQLLHHEKTDKKTMSVVVRIASHDELQSFVTEKQNFLINNKIS